MEKLWLKSYEPGVPEFINPDQYPSLVDLATECFAKFKEKTCYTNMGASLSYQQVDEKSQAFAGFLQQTCRLAKGERVAIMMPNVMQYPVALFGILRAGMVVVNVNPLYTPRELRRVLQDSGAKCIVVLANFANVLERALEGSQIQHVVVTELGDLLGCVKGALVNLVVKHVKKMYPTWHIPNAVMFKDIMCEKQKKAFKPEMVTGEDIAFLQYTGGTTGGVKGAILTHRNMVSNVLQAYTWIESSLLNQPIEGGIITALPLYHIFSLTANCLVFLRVGIPQYFNYQSPRYSRLY